jgi:hypothetical protein
MAFMNPIEDSDKYNAAGSHLIIIAD